MSSSRFLAIFRRAAKTVIDNSQYLSELDMIGDADLGVNVSNGFEMVLRELSKMQDPDVGTTLKTAGDVFVFDIGATIGGLLGRSFQSAAKQMQGKRILSSQDLVTMLQTMLITVKAVGGASAGDKTLVDALEPAVVAGKAAIQSGSKDIQQVMDKMATAAEEGARGTATIASRIGRSSYLGERSRGKIDPGAMLISLFLNAMRNSLRS
jgi:dihydroxyacetone kinase-like protein